MGSRSSQRLPSETVCDVLVCALIFALGALQFAFPLRSNDFFMGDTIYAELAHSIVENGSYGLDYNAMPAPPGLPALLALVCAATGCGHEVLLRSMAVFVTLGLLASYWFLKRKEGVACAAATCLLIASSPIVFAISTGGVTSDFPYFFTSMTTLLLAAALETNASAPARTRTLVVLCSVMLVSSLLIRSSGVALIAGLAGWLAISRLWVGKATGAQRMRTFAGILIAGIVVQATWMAWVARHETVEWPTLDGYPREYLSQLKVLHGIQPELGPASLIDVVGRVPENLVSRAVGIAQLVTRKDYIEGAWYSPLVFGPACLVVLGLWCSLWPTGGALAEWYFMSHEAMYLLWPWPFEMRFLLPIAPLVGLYLWRGARECWRLLELRPWAGVAGALVGLLAGAAAGSASWNSGSLQSKLAVLFWAAVVAASVALSLRAWSRRPSRSIPSALFRQLSMPTSRLALPQIVGAFVATALIALGIALEVPVAKENRSFDLTKNPAYGSVSAARWIADNTAATAVVMARQLDVVHYHAHRRVVWFPPISNPQVLMEGIHRLGADFILVTRTWAYYLPSDEICIDALLKEYPHSFRVAKEERQFRIIEVLERSH